MAFDAANQVVKAQRVYTEGIYDAYAKKPDFLRFFESKTEDVPTNYLGRQVTIETGPNPSLAYGNPDGGDFATPGNPTLDNLTVTYQWVNAGFEQTLAAMMNNNKETVDDPFKRAVKSSAKQFSQWLNYYVSAGNGTTALAIASANYAGGTPTVIAVNGATDGFGATRLVPLQYGFWYDPTGTTQRVGTVGAGVLRIASKTKIALTFTTNLPSDLVIGDIFVPEGGNTVGIKGLPYLIGNSGNLFNKSRTAVTQLQSQVIAVSGALTAASILQLYAQMGQATDTDDSGQTDWFTIATAWAQWYNYISLTTVSPVFTHDSSGRPGADVGAKSLQTTWFGAPMRRFKWLKADELYMLSLKNGEDGGNAFAMAVLKKAGQILPGMPASDWIQAINGTTSSYRTARQQFLDFAGDAYVRTPYAQGKLTGLTMAQAMQKS